MTRIDLDMFDAFSILEFCGAGLDSPSFVGLVPLRAGRAIRRGDRLGERRALTGIVTFSPVSPVSPQGVDTEVQSILDAITPLAFTIRSLLFEQGSEWCIRVFDGSTPGAGYDGILPSTFGRANAINLPIKREADQ